MASPPTPIFMSEIFDFLASTPTPHDILAYRPSPQLVERSQYLHERNRKDALTDTERDEFDELRRINHFMNQLKIHTRLKVQTTG